MNLAILLSCSYYKTPMVILLKVYVLFPTSIATVLHKGGTFSHRLPKIVAPKLKFEPLLWDLCNDLFAEK